MALGGSSLPQPTNLASRLNSVRLRLRSGSHRTKAPSVDDAETPPDSEALTTQHLDVYATKNGQWNPEHGDIEIPADWEFLPSGDAFLTRTVKAAGAYWLSWQPRRHHRQHRRLLGMWAPGQVIAAAQARAEETAVDPPLPQRGVRTRTCSLVCAAAPDSGMSTNTTESIVRRDVHALLVPHPTDAFGGTPKPRAHDDSGRLVA